MDVTKIAIKLFASPPVPELREFIPVFHHWIQTRAVEDHLLIDVADYAHVANGPGVVLVATEANFYFDFSDDRPGLLYTRKTASPGSFGERLRATTVACLKAAEMLQQEPAFGGRLQFDTTQLLVRLDDRLLAPNTQATFDEVKPELESLAAEIYAGGSPTLHWNNASTKLFSALVKSMASPKLSELLDRLQAHSR
jgi:hypothetical protein